jgi:hypothetical protein
MFWSESMLDMALHIVFEFPESIKRPVLLSAIISVMMGRNYDIRSYHNIFAYFNRPCNPATNPYAGIVANFNTGTASKISTFFDVYVFTRRFKDARAYNPAHPPRPQTESRAGGGQITGKRIIKH